MPWLAGIGGQPYNNWGSLWIVCTRGCAIVTCGILEMGESKAKLARLPGLEREDPEMCWGPDHRFYTAGRIPRADPLDEHLAFPWTSLRRDNTHPAKRFGKVDGY